MRDKNLLKISAISLVLVMIASCVTPCIAVDNSTNNISNSSISLENTSVNVSVENTSKTVINANAAILAMLIVEEGFKAEQVIYRESLGDLGLDALFVKITKSEVSTLLKKDGVKNAFFPEELYATFIVKPAKATTAFALASNANATVSSTLNKEYLVISGVYNNEEVLKLAEEAEVNSLRVKSLGAEIGAKAVSGKLDGALASLPLLTPEDKVNVIVELKDIPKYKGLSYKEASEKARESEVVKDAIKAVEDLGGDFLDYWHWYGAIDIEIEASKLSELARYDFVEKIMCGGKKWKIEPIVGVEATDERPTVEINNITRYINAKNFHDQGYDGSGIKVGIIDTGIDASHPEFADAIIKERYDCTGTGFEDYVGPWNGSCELCKLYCTKG